MPAQPVLLQKGGVRYTENRSFQIRRMELLMLVLFIWVIVLSKRTGDLRREMDELREGKVGAKARAVPAAAEPEEPPVEQIKPQTKKVSEPAAPQRSFEERVGMQWFQWLGIAALIAALLFFLKWAYDNNLIGPTGRTVIGYVLAGIAIVAGDRLRGKYGVWSLAFTGGGALASYIVTWYALHNYQLFPSSVAMMVYVLTTVVICLLAGYYNSIPLAAFGIIGGLLTPLLTGEGGSVIGLLTYVLILDVGVLALSHMRNWRTLNGLAFVGTLLWEGYAFAEGGVDRQTAFLFMAAFGTIYLLVPAMYNIMRRSPGEFCDLVILIGNGIAHFALVLGWLEQTPGLREQMDGPIALGFAVIFLWVAYGIYKQNKKDTPLVLSGLSLTVLFTSVAIPLQLNNTWTSVAWSVEAAFLLWMALYLKDKRIQLFAWPVMGAAYWWYLFMPEGTSIPLVFLPVGFWIFLLWALMLSTMAVMALQSNDKETRPIIPFALCGGVILLYALFLQVQDGRGDATFLHRFIETAAIIGGSYAVLLQALRQWSSLNAEERRGFITLGIAVQIITVSYLTYEFVLAVENKWLFAGAQRPDQMAQMGTSIFWGFYSVLTLVVGFVKGWRPLRLFGMTLLLVTIAKLTLIDLSSLGTGYRVVGFAILGALLIGASFLYQRNKAQFKEFFATTTPKQ